MSSTLRLFWEAAGGNVPEHWEFKTIDELLEHPKAISAVSYTHLTLPTIYSV